MTTALDASTATLALPSSSSETDFHSIPSLSEASEVASATSEPSAEPSAPSNPNAHANEDTHAQADPTSAFAGTDADASTMNELDFLKARGRVEYFDASSVQPPVPVSTGLAQSASVSSTLTNLRAASPDREYIDTAAATVPSLPSNHNKSPSESTIAGGHRPSISDKQWTFRKPGDFAKEAARRVSQESGSRSPVDSRSSLASPSLGRSTPSESIKFPNMPIIQPRDESIGCVAARRARLAAKGKQRAIDSPEKSRAEHKEHSNARPATPTRPSPPKRKTSTHRPPATPVRSTSTSAIVTPSSVATSPGARPLRRPMLPAASNHQTPSPGLDRQDYEAFLGKSPSSPLREPQPAAAAFSKLTASSSKADSETRAARSNSFGSQLQSSAIADPMVRTRSESVASRQSPPKPARPPTLIPADSDEMDVILAAADVSRRRKRSIDSNMALNIVQPPRAGTPSGASALNGATTVYDAVQGPSASPIRDSGTAKSASKSASARLSDASLTNTNADARQPGKMSSGFSRFRLLPKWKRNERPTSVSEPTEPTFAAEPDAIGDSPVHPMSKFDDDEDTVQGSKDWTKVFGVGSKFGSPAFERMSFIGSGGGFTPRNSVGPRKMSISNQDSREPSTPFATIGELAAAEEDGAEPAQPQRGTWRQAWHLVTSSRGSQAGGASTERRPSRLSLHGSRPTSRIGDEIVTISPALKAEELPGAAVTPPVIAETTQKRPLVHRKEVPQTSSRFLAVTPQEFGLPITRRSSEAQGDPWQQPSPNSFVHSFSDERPRSPTAELFLSPTNGAAPPKLVTPAPVDDSPTVPWATWSRPSVDASQDGSRQELPSVMEEDHLADDLYESLDAAQKHSELSSQEADKVIKDVRMERGDTSVSTGDMSASVEDASVTLTDERDKKLKRREMHKKRLSAPFIEAMGSDSEEDEDSRFEKQDLPPIPTYPRKGSTDSQLSPAPITGFELFPQDRRPSEAPTEASSMEGAVRWKGTPDMPAIANNAGERRPSEASQWGQPFPHPAVPSSDGHGDGSFQQHPFRYRPPPIKQSVEVFKFPKPPAVHWAPHPQIGGVDFDADRRAFSMDMGRGGDAPTLASILAPRPSDVGTTGRPSGQSLAARDTMMRSATEPFNRQPAMQQESAPEPSWSATTMPTLPENKELPDVGQQQHNDDRQEQSLPQDQQRKPEHQRQTSMLSLASSSSLFSDSSRFGFPSMVNGQQQHSSDGSNGRSYDMRRTSTGMGSGGVSVESAATTMSSPTASKRGSLNPFTSSFADSAPPPPFRTSKMYLSGPSWVAPSPSAPRPASQSFLPSSTSLDSQLGGTPTKSENSRAQTYGHKLSKSADGLMAFSNGGLGIQTPPAFATADLFSDSLATGIPDQIGLSPLLENTSSAPHDEDDDVGPAIIGDDDVLPNGSSWTSKADSLRPVSTEASWSTEGESTPLATTSALPPMNHASNYTNHAKGSLEVPSAGGMPAPLHSLSTIDEMSTSASASDAASLLGGANANHAHAMANEQPGMAA